MKTLLLFSIALISSCSFTGKLKKQAKRVNQDYLQELSKQSAERTGLHYEADWETAKKDLFWKNSRVQRSYFQIEDSIEQKVRVWKNMIPSLNASISDSATIEDISNLFVNTNFRISSFINLGNLLTMPKRIATLNLRHIGTELNAEQAMRNEVIALYRTFREQELLDLEKKALDWELEFLEETTLDSSSIDFILEKEELTEKKVEFAKKMEDWFDKVSDTLTTHYNTVRLHPEGLPDIYYKAEDLDFTDSKRWGTLQMNLLALQLLANEGQLLLAYTRYLPTPFLSVSAPPLYSSTNSRSFRLSEVRLSPSLNWRIDTQGSISNQIKRIKREKPLKKWEQDKRLASEVKKLIEGKEALIKVQKELQENQQLTQQFRNIVQEGLVQDLPTALKTMLSLKSKEVALRAVEVDICTQLWLIDETKWGETTKQWKRARIDQKKAIKQNKKNRFLKKLGLKK